MTVSKRSIMVRAWEIVRTMTGDVTAKLSYALHKAWKEVKAMVIEMSKEEKFAAKARIAIENLRSDSNLVKLTGSEKQIAWATILRRDFINEAISEIENMISSSANDARILADFTTYMVSSRSESKFWIDDRCKKLESKRNNYFREFHMSR